jgi:N-methylhydantoinase B
MNNVSFGNDRFVYFETLAGGQGASRGGDGPDAVHVAMTNTLNTPIEVLEQEYPLRVERYGVRHGSGGAGRHRGGDGVVRAYRVLAPCKGSLVTERRTHLPAGAAGGAPGAVGENRLNGKKIGSKVSLDLAAGDVIELRTPGGGGWGRPRR